MYYLNSRYYNPVVGRFINADGMLGQVGNALSTNMYAYCANNPVMYTDPSGEFAILTVLLITTAIGALIGATTSTVTQLYENNYDWDEIVVKEVIASTLLGAATGLAFGLGASAGAIIAGKVAIASLSMSSSVYLLMGSALAVNVTAGASAYIIRNLGSSDFSYSKLILSAAGQAGKGMIAFGLGAYFSGVGYWNHTISRVVTRQIVSIFPNYYFDTLYFD